MPLKNDSNTNFQISLKKMKYYLKIIYEREETETPAKLITRWTNDKLRSETNIYNTTFKFSASVPSMSRKMKVEKERDANHIIILCYLYHTIFCFLNLIFCN